MIATFSMEPRFDWSQPTYFERLNRRELKVRRIVACVTVNSHRHVYFKGALTSIVAPCPGLETKSSSAPMWCARFLMLESL